MLSCFKLESEDESEDEEELELSFAKKVLLRDSTPKSKYRSTIFIPSTSVCVESLFSTAGWMWFDRRASTLPVHIEEQMFLRTNSMFWDANTIQRVLNNKSESGNGSESESKDEGESESESESKSEDESVSKEEQEEGESEDESEN